MVLPKTSTPSGGEYPTGVLPATTAVVSDTIGTGARVGITSVSGVQASGCAQGVAVGKGVGDDQGVGDGVRVGKAVAVAVTVGVAVGGGCVGEAVGVIVGEGVFICGFGWLIWATTGAQAEVVPAKPKLKSSV